MRETELAALFGEGAWVPLPSLLVGKGDGGGIVSIVVRGLPVVARARRSSGRPVFLAREGINNTPLLDIHTNKSFFFELGVHLPSSLACLKERGGARSFPTAAGGARARAYGRQSEEGFRVCEKVVRMKWEVEKGCGAVVSARQPSFPTSKGALLHRRMTEREKK